MSVLGDLKRSAADMTIDEIIEANKNIRAKRESQPLQKKTTKKQPTKPEAKMTMNELEKTMQLLKGLE